MGDPNVDVMHRVYDINNSGHLDLADEFVAENLIDHEVPPHLPSTREAWKTWVGVLRTAFPDVHISIHDTIAEGDKVMI